MKLSSENLCDFCFAPVSDGDKCTQCALTHDTYKPIPGLLLPGVNLLGKYIIGRVLGRGGFGATYVAYSSNMKKPVAIKEYFPISISYRTTGDEQVTLISEDKRQVFEKGAKSFYEEARTISKFKDNKSVVSVYEFFYANGTVYYAMEYLDGCDLKEYVGQKSGKLSDGDIIKIIKSLCEALLPIHGAKILHRDITPDNIYICKNGDIKLIDFGAARQLVSEESQGYSVVLKQGFAPVEQYTRKGKQGAWTDIYSLGATMYYAASGKVPPDALDRVGNPELNIDECNVSPGLMYIIKKCMAFESADRYQNILELMRDIEYFLNTDAAKTDDDIKEPEQPAAGDTPQKKDTPSPKKDIVKSDEPPNKTNNESRAATKNGNSKKAVASPGKSAEKIFKDTGDEPDKTKDSKQDDFGRIRSKSLYVLTIAIVFLVIFSISLYVFSINKQRYDLAMVKMERGNFEDAYDLLAEVMFVNENSVIYKNAQHLMDIGQYKYAGKAFAALDDYKESKRLKSECNYAYALNCVEIGDVTTAYEVFLELGNYSDSAQKAAELKAIVISKP